METTGQITDENYYPLPEEPCQDGSGRVYIRIGRDWHKLLTPHGTFFGSSKAEVEDKAARAAELAAIAREEQAAFLGQADSQRGVRVGVL